MNDPVILISFGETYDRSSIEKWLKDGNQRCPQTNQIMSNMVLVPNHLAQIKHLTVLLKKLESVSISDHKDAAKELRWLTEHMPSIRPRFSDISNSISQLLIPVYLLAIESHDSHHHPDGPGLRDDVLTIILYISKHDGNKKIVAEDPLAFSFLTGCLNSRNIEERTKAAASFLTLSSLDSNKYRFGKAWAFELLINLLDGGLPLASKHASQAIFSICSLDENKDRAVSQGAVSVIMKEIKERFLVDELLATLALLSGHDKAINSMRELDAISSLLSILRENTSEQNNQNCRAILYTLGFPDQTKQIPDRWGYDFYQGPRGRHCSFFNLCKHSVI